MKAFLTILGLGLLFPLQAREWMISGQNAAVEATYEGQGNGFVLLKGESGPALEVAISDFAAPDQEFLRVLGQARPSATSLEEPGEVRENSQAYRVNKAERITGRFLTPEPGSELHLTGEKDVLAGSWVNFEHADGWLFLRTFPRRESSPTIWSGFW
jgi:hypothetical protein